MKILSLLLFFIFSLKELNAQTNLCGNSSFEIYDSCVTNEDQVPYATGWRNFCGTPDYFDTCSTNPNLSVPYNWYGSYQPSSTGAAYCGFYSYWSTAFSGGYVNIREHIGRQLDSPLTVGVKYFASMKVSLAVNPWKEQCATNNLGIKFTTVPFDEYGTDSVTSPLVNNFAHIYTTSIISDTINWTTISGSFIADSAYNYLVIANFFKDANTDTLIIYLGQNYCYSYYYIDDVIVMRDTTKDTTDAIKQIDLENETKINISNGMLSIQMKSNDKASIEIYNLLGQLILRDIFAQNYSASFSEKSSGIYLLKIKTNKGMLIKKFSLI